jgi:putative nucleotidyltransferase with HDIG domain
MRQDTPLLPLSARLYIAFICSAAAIASVYQFRSSSHLELSLQFLLYLAIALVSSGMKVLPPQVNGNISVNYVFTLLGLLEFNVAETMLLAVTAAVAQTFWHAKVRPKAIHVFFNVSCILLTVFVAGSVYHQPYFSSMGEKGQLLRLVLAGVSYFLVNTVSVAIVIALAEDKPVRSVWSAFYNWLFAYYLVGVSLAEMVHFSIGHLGWTFTLALLPLLYIIYRSYRLYMDKMQQQTIHAENTAALHLRTIEALAMAIEAKDECTGEHLRRVQIYCLQVAEHLGLTQEEKQALQAASILHDIGKLAVPDYIISKPGKLTPEEFDKMKIHTIVGAAILEEVGSPTRYRLLSVLTTSVGTAAAIRMVFGPRLFRSAPEFFPPWIVLTRWPRTVNTGAPFHLTKRWHT